MNINELSSSLYGTNIRTIQSTGYDSKLLKKAVDGNEKPESFEDILSSYALSGDTEDLVDSIKTIEDNLDEKQSDNVDKSDVMSILTDAHIAKEYLESKSGRNLIVSMVDNQIAGIISGNSDDK